MLPLILKNDRSRKSDDIGGDAASASRPRLAVVAASSHRLPGKKQTPGIHQSHQLT